MTHAPLHNTLPPGHWHSQVLGLTDPPLEVHASFAGHSHWQLVLSTFGGEQTSTHWPPHTVFPLGHWHFPPTQLAPCAQALPQRPQLATSVARSRHTPPQSV